ncbi:MAG TPA: hypothetical protein VMG11_07610 [Steroidobacteraceae bacterium]|nr:hypothetical protein [Steroidobacteraceae bacterium]
MKATLLICVAVLGGLMAAPPARADDCVLPPPPSKIPDGTQASQQEMVSAMQTMKQYDGDVNVYLKCLDFEERQKHLGPDDAEARHNAAVAQLEKVAAKFNDQVRVFKAKHG